MRALCFLILALIAAARATPCAAQSPPDCSSLHIVIVTCYGADPTGSEDSTTEIQNAINYAESLPDGPLEIFVPNGTYCIKTGPLVFHNLGTSMRGASKYSTFLSACTIDNTLINMTFGSEKLRDISLQGKGSCCNDQSSFGANNPTLVIGPNCIECYVFYTDVDGGSYPISIASAEAWLDHVIAADGYGTAIVYVTGSVEITKAKLDQQSVAGCTTIGGVSTIANWSPGMTNIPACGVYALTGTYAGRLIQAVPSTGPGSNTSGSIQPTPKNYGISFQDGGTGGTVTWQFFSNSTYYAMQMDGPAMENSCLFCDFGGLWSGAAVGMTGTNPQFFNCIYCDFDTGFNQTIYLSKGGAASIIDSSIAGCLLANCSVINATSGWTGPLRVRGGYINAVPSGIGNTYAITLNGGLQTTIDGVSIIGGTAGGILIGPGVSQFNIVNNFIAGNGHPTITVSPGASDYFNIQNNISLVGSQQPGIICCAGVTGTHYAVGLLLNGSSSTGGGNVGP
jgi:Pectate lyase superfamily protein